MQLHTTLYIYYLIIICNSFIQTITIFICKKSIDFYFYNAIINNKFFCDLLFVVLRFTSFFICFAMLFLASCANRKVVDLRSPCVGGSKSPCAHIPINKWLYQDFQYPVAA